MKNYLLSWKHKVELASAFLAEDSKSDHELINGLEGKKYFTFHFQLKRIQENKTGLVIDDNLSVLKEIWLDYQPNNLAWPLMSEKLRSIIENQLTGHEGVDWIECKIKKQEEERIYFIPRFNKMLDVLDFEKTSFVADTDHIIKPVFSAEKISAYSIFFKPLSHNLWKITPGIYVNENIRKIIKKEKLTGIDFESASVA